MKRVVCACGSGYGVSSEDAHAVACGEVPQSDGAVVPARHHRHVVVAEREPAHRTAVPFVDTEDISRLRIKDTH